MNRSSTTYAAPLRSGLPPKQPASRGIAPPAKAHPSVQLTPLAGTAFSLAAIQLFLIESRVSDFLAMFTGTSASLVMIVSILALIAAAAAGGVPRALTSVPGLLLTAFSAWCLLSLPFSVWKGGSYVLLKEVWIKSYLFFIIAAGAFVTLEHCRKAMVMITLAAGFVILMTFVSGDIGTGRLAFEQGLIGNSNDLAAYLLTTLPFFLMIALTADKALVRLMGGAGGVLALIVTMKTGSRSGFITACFLIAVLFFKMSAGNKIRLVAIGTPVVFLAILLAPETAIERYRTLFSDEVSTTDDELARRQIEMARGSSESRWALFMLSLDLTLRNPLLGVGPGMFGVATSEDQKNMERKLAYRESHVTYTQLSSETGIPGLLFYGGALFYCLRVTNRLYKQGKYSKEATVKRTANMAMCLNLSLVVYSVFACFGSIAYTFTFPVLAGLTVAFQSAASPVLAAAIRPMQNRILPTQSIRPHPASRAV